MCLRTNGCVGTVRMHTCCSAYHLFLHAVLHAVLQAKQQNGKDYKRTALLDMVRGVIRVINASYRHLEIDGKPAPAPLSLSKDAKLSTAADSTCRQLTAAGLGKLKQQPSFKPHELAHLLDIARQLPKSAYSHNLRKYLWLELEWGGRASEVAALSIR